MKLVAEAGAVSRQPGNPSGSEQICGSLSSGRRFPSGRNCFAVRSLMGEGKWTAALTAMLPSLGHFPLRRGIRRTPMTAILTTFPVTECDLLRKRERIAADCRSNDFDIFATLMMHTGYLTAARSQWSGREQELEGENLKPVLGTGEEPSQDLASEGTIWLRIPNEEVRQCFRAKARFLTGRGNPVWVSRSRELISALFAGEAEKAERLLSDMLLSYQCSGRNL